MRTPMPIIKLMDSKLANMIAAGEVVDRPASVIKELVENAIDAKATQIRVESFDMGMKKIVVTDDGIGMDLVDAHMAFSRHATSKIMDEQDLNHIQTLGFRGEALAAIASVSKVILKTRQKNNEGIQVTYHGGHFISEGVASLNQGTIVEVSDLFYNTPARFKYIKSDFAEKTAIIDIFDRLALAHPEIRFSLYMDSKLIKQTFGNRDFHSLIDQIYGTKITEGMTVFEHMVSKIHIKGFLISPLVSRSRKKDISIFVNGRYIKNYALIQAVIEGYHSMLMVGKYPIALIYLEMDPSLLDVNVHPQKYEVKFVNESMLAYHIELFVKESLLKKTHAIPETLKDIKKMFKETYTPTVIDFSIDQESVHETEVSLPKLPELEYIGVFSGTYLLFQNDQGLYLMDQHAAAERIRYEHYYKALSKPSQAIKNLLVPHELTLTNEDLDVLNHYLSTFESYGFGFDSNLHLTHLPIWLEHQEIEIALESMLTMLTETKKIDLAQLRDHLAKDISCKGAIKANKALNLNEIKALMIGLKSCENPYTCPHGRPTLIKLSHYDIERMFKRVVS